MAAGKKRGPLGAIGAGFAALMAMIFGGERIAAKVGRFWEQESKAGKIVEPITEVIRRGETTAGKFPKTVPAEGIPFTAPKVPPFQLKQLEPVTPVMPASSLMLRLSTLRRD